MSVANPKEDLEVEEAETLAEYCTKAMKAERKRLAIDGLVSLRHW
jgi:hypothetical protein